MELNLKLTPDQIQLLNNILFDDCTYLENCTESEFNSYTVIRKKLTTTLHNHFNGTWYTTQSHINRSTNRGNPMFFRR